LSPSASDPNPRPRRKNGRAPAFGKTASKSSRPPGVEELVASVPEGDLPDLFRFWAGREKVETPADPDELRQAITGWMRTPEVLEARIAEMGRRLQSIFDVHLAARGYECPVSELVTAKQLAYLSSYDLEASLAALVRHGLLVPSKSGAVERFGARAHAVPRELGDQILRQRRARRRGIFDVVTLKGHLDRLYSDPARTRRAPGASRRRACASCTRCTPTRPRRWRASSACPTACGAWSARRCCSSAGSCRARCSSAWRPISRTGTAAAGPRSSRSRWSARSRGSSSGATA
jgi:hypothetical protein